MELDLVMSLLKKAQNFPTSTVFLLLLCACVVAGNETLFRLSDRLLVAVEQKYGEFARNRLLSWQTLIRGDKSNNDREKLEKVNQFFNQMTFVDDIIHWKKKDYWATPVEFLVTKGGDCEDFSLAKYFTLMAMGIPESKINMTYVKALRPNQAHMVVTYYPTPGAEPLVLDNLMSEIKPSSQRQDLIPVYSFNGSGLWLAKARGRGKKVGGSDNLKKWQDLLERMPEALL